MSNLHVFGDLLEYGLEEPSFEQIQLSQPHVLEEIERRPCNSCQQLLEKEQDELKKHQRMISMRSLVIVFEVKFVYENCTKTIPTSHCYNKNMEVHAWSQVE